MMRIGLASAALVLTMSGCVAPQNETYRYVPPPVCTNDRQCAAMWSEATRQVEYLSGMKIRLLTDSYIETFDGTVQQLLLGKVRKSPNPAGQGYVIQGSFHCRVSLCRVIKAREAEFNQMVTVAGAAFASAPPAASGASSDASAPGQSRPGDVRKRNPAADYPEKQKKQTQARTLYLECVRGAGQQTSTADAALKACEPQLAMYRAAAFAALQASESGDPSVGVQAAQDEIVNEARKALGKP